MKYFNLCKLSVIFTLFFLMAFDLRATETITNAKWLAESNIYELTVNDGLPTGAIWGLAIDQSNVLWIAGKTGLNYYRRGEFHAYELDKNNLKPINAVHVDKNDRVLAGGGESEFYFISQDRKKIKYYTAEVMNGDGVNEFVEEKNGNIWIWSLNGKIFKLKNNSIEESSFDENLIVTSVCADIHGGIWLSTIDGIYRIKNDVVEKYVENFSKKKITGIEQDLNGDLWLTLNDGDVYVVDARDKSYKKSENNYSYIQLDSKGREIYKNQEEIYIKSKNEIIKEKLFNSSLKEYASLKKIVVDNDDNGGIWITDYKSLWYIAGNWENIKKLSVNNKNIKREVVMGVYRYKKYKYIFNYYDYAGFYIFDSIQNKIIFVHDEDFHSVVSVCGNEGDDLYFLSPGKINKYNFRTKLKETFEINFGEYSFDCASGLDDELFGTNDDLKAGKINFNKKNANFELVNGVGNAYIVGPMFIHNKKFHMLMSDGLYIYDKKNNYATKVLDSNGSKIQALAVDGDNLYVAKYGVFEIYKLAYGKYVLIDSLSSIDGYPKDLISGMIYHNDGIWMAGSVGLYKVDLKQRNVRIYNNSDGYNIKGVLGIEEVKSKMDGFLINSLSGIYFINKKNIVQNQRNPVLNVDEIYTNGIDGVKKHKNMLNKVNFSFGENNIFLKTSMNNNFNSYHNKFQYMLVGNDKNWIEVNKEGNIVFSNLPPGSYQLKIRGKDSSNVWSDTKILNIVINPPWWKTWWAYGLYVIFGLFVVWLIMYDYKSRLSKRHALISTEKERQIALKASEEKSKFLATLGHEVRTPMTGVLGMSELLMKTELNEKQAGFVQSIQHAGKHLLRLLNDALDLAKIESGKFDLDPQPFNLKECLQQIEKFVTPIAEAKQIYFSLKIQESVPTWIEGDVIRIRQVLLNLINNAIKFTEYGGIVLDVSAPTLNRLQFDVIDTGPGMNDEQLKRIFERFEQAEGARTSARYGGSGLGLAISQELVSLMKGDIRVESGLGEGTRFTVELPYTHVERSEEYSNQLETAELPPLRILLVEDDATVAKVIAGLLSAEGHHVEHVEHGLAALTIMSLSQFDVALLDLDLPGIDGLSLIKQLIAMNSEMPAIAVTARADVDIERQVMAAGFSYFVRKPVDGATLQHALKSVMASKMSASH